MTIAVGTFVIGNRTVVLCSTPLSIDFIQWRDDTGGVLIDTTSETELELVFDPVNDSATLQGSEFTCAVGTGGEEAVQSFTVSIIGICLNMIIVCMLHEERH